MGLQRVGTTERFSFSLSYGGSEVSWLIQDHPARTKPGFRLSIFLVKYGLSLRFEYTLQGASALCGHPGTKPPSLL